MKLDLFDFYMYFVSTVISSCFTAFFHIIWILPFDALNKKYLQFWTLRIDMNEYEWYERKKCIIAFSFMLASTTAFSPSISFKFILLLQ